MSDTSTQQYAISEWHDTDEIYRRLNELIRQPIRPIRRDRMQDFLSYFEIKCARSKALTDEAKKLIPGGVQHNLAFNLPFPLAVGGITPKMVPNVIKDLGPDIVIGSGGGVHAHPQGPVAGARAFRQAIQATLQGRSLEDAAKEYPELKAALEVWVDPFKGMGM